MREPVGKREIAGEDLELHSVVVRGDDGLVYKLKDTPTSERGLNCLPAKVGEEVPVIWGVGGVVHDIQLAGRMQITPTGKGLMAYSICMKLLVEKDYYTDPEQWNELNTGVQDAWMVIGAEWFPDPAE